MQALVKVLNDVIDVVANGSGCPDNMPYAIKTWLSLSFVGSNCFLPCAINLIKDLNNLGKLLEFGISPIEELKCNHFTLNYINIDVTDTVSSVAAPKQELNQATPINKICEHMRVHRNMFSQML